VAFRITLKTNGTTPIVRLDGWLTQDAVASLRSACSPPMSAPVVLDLSEVRSIECGALDELRALSHTGVRLVRVPHYIQMLLGRVTEQGSMSSARVRRIKPRGGRARESARKPAFASRGPRWHGG
jgi:hypothetical protein